MPWHVCRTRGSDFRSIGRAETDLERHGVRTFWPRLHKFFICKQSKDEKHRIAALIPGYLFVDVRSPSDRDITIGSPYTTREPFLGSWTGETFYPTEIPTNYITTLIDHGPWEVGKQNSRKPFQKGQKVRLVLGKVADIIARVEGLDQSGKIIVNAELLGASRLIHVEHDRLELADNSYGHCQAIAAQR